MANLIAKYNQPKSKKEHFIWLKTILTWIASSLTKEYSEIPAGIGSSIILTNSSYITMKYMSSIIEVSELGGYVPVGFMSVLLQALRKRGSKAVMDFSYITKPWAPDLKESNVNIRQRVWRAQADDETNPPQMRARATRCLYTIEVAKSGQQLYKTRLFITLRAKTSSELEMAEAIILSQLTAYGCVANVITHGMKDSLEHMSLLSHHYTITKNQPSCVTTNSNLSQMVGNLGSYNDKEGTFIGINCLNNTPYFIDYKTITVARNMCIFAPSGVGKTVLALSMLQSAYESGAACACVDVKGTDYVNFIRATGGSIVSLKPDSTEYLNSWKLKPEDIGNATEKEYYSRMLTLSKQQFLILSGLTETKDIVNFEAMLDAFYKDFYANIGVVAYNIKTWDYSNSLDPFNVYDKFLVWAKPSVFEHYNLPDTIITTLNMYFLRDGLKSYIFTKEMSLASALKSRTISFDLGLLSSVGNSDEVYVNIIKLKFLYMTWINTLYTESKYTEGLRTFKVLEEAQIISEEMLHFYSEEITVRRAQRQDTLLIANSVSALMNRDTLRTLVENLKAIFVGELTADARELLLQNFDMKYLSSLIKIPGSAPEYKNTFLFINKMQDKQLYPIIKVQFPDSNISGTLPLIYQPVYRSK